MSAKCVECSTHDLDKALCGWCAGDLHAKGSSWRDRAARAESESAASSAREARLREALGELVRDMDAGRMYCSEGCGGFTSKDYPDLLPAALADPPRPVEGPERRWTWEDIAICVGAVSDVRPNWTLDDLWDLLNDCDDEEPAPASYETAYPAHNPAPCLRCGRPLVCAPCLEATSAVSAPAPRYTREEVGKVLEAGNLLAQHAREALELYGVNGDAVVEAWEEAVRALTPSLHPPSTAGGDSDPFGPTCDATHPTHGRCLAPVGHTGPHGSDRDVHWPATPDGDRCKSCGGAKDEFGFDASSCPYCADCCPGCASTTDDGKEGGK